MIEINKIPTDIMCYILDFVPYNSVNNDILCFNKQIYKVREKKLKFHINKISDWWKKYNIKKNFIEELVDCLDPENIHYMIAPNLYKNNFINNHIFENDKKYLYMYPEFYINKLYSKSGDIPLEIKKFLKHYDYKNPRTYDVYRFLKLKEVSMSKILYVGW